VRRAVRHADRRSGGSEPAHAADEPLPSWRPVQAQADAARPGVLGYAGSCGQATHRGLRHRTQRRDVHRGQARPAVQCSPVLNAAVYYLIFGIIIDTSAGAKFSPS